MVCDSGSAAPFAVSSCHYGILAHGCICCVRTAHGAEHHVHLCPAAALCTGTPAYDLLEEETFFIVL